MTAEEFDKRYPNGLNRVIYLFQTAMMKAIKDGELDKVIKHTRGSERRKAKRFKKIAEKYKLAERSVPIWGVLPVIESNSFLQDIIAYMVIEETSVVHGADLENGNKE